MKVVRLTEMWAEYPSTRVGRFKVQVIFAILLFSCTTMLSSCAVKRVEASAQTSCYNADSLDTLSISNPSQSLLENVKAMAVQTEATSENVEVTFSAPVLMASPCTQLTGIGKFSLGTGSGSMVVLPSSQFSHLQPRSSVGVLVNQQRLTMGLVFNKGVIDLDAPQLENRVLPAGRSWLSITPDTINSETFRSDVAFFSQIIYSNPQFILELLANYSDIAEPINQQSGTSGASSVALVQLDLSSAQPNFHGEYASLYAQLLSSTSLMENSTSSGSTLAPASSTPGSTLAPASSMPTQASSFGTVNAIVGLNANGEISTITLYPPGASLGTVTFYFLESNPIRGVSSADSLSVPSIVKKLQVPPSGLITSAGQVLGSSGSNEGAEGNEGAEPGGS